MRIVQLLFGVWVGICFLACGEKSDSFTGGGTGTYRAFGRRGYYAPVSCNKPGRFIVPAFAGKRIPGKKMSRRKPFVF